MNWPEISKLENDRGIFSEKMSEILLKFPPEGTLDHDHYEPSPVRLATTIVRSPRTHIRREINFS